MNRRLPVIWWQRPQYWSRFSEGDDGEVVSMAARMWRIRELTPWSLDTALRNIQPNGAADDG